MSFPGSASHKAQTGLAYDGDDNDDADTDDNAVMVVPDFGISGDDGDGEGGDDDSIGDDDDSIGGGDWY